MPLALVLAYPLLVHLGVLLQWPPLRGAGLLCLFAAVFWAPLRAGRAAAWAGFAAFAALVLGLMRIGGDLYALYLPPLALTALALAAFARSLTPGQVPLIEQFATAARGPLDAAMRRHTRRSTWIWTANLALMLAIIGALSLWGPRSVWSWFTNVIAYFWMAALLVLDYLYRRWRLPEHDRQGLAGHLRDVLHSVRGVRR